MFVFPTDETICEKRERNVREAHPGLSPVAYKRISAIIVTSQMSADAVADLVWEAQTKGFLDEIP
jgi:hypothetical protein